MYILNPEIIKRKIILPKEVGYILEKKYNIPVLFKNDTEYMFSNTEELVNLLETKTDLMRNLKRINIDD